VDAGNQVDPANVLRLSGDAERMRSSSDAGASYALTSALFNRQTDGRTGDSEGAVDKPVSVMACVPQVSHRDWEGEPRAW
jgi:hypothetical protein